MTSIKGRDIPQRGGEGGGEDSGAFLRSEPGAGKSRARKGASRRGRSAVRELFPELPEKEAYVEEAVHRLSSEERFASLAFQSVVTEGRVGPAEFSRIVRALIRACESRGGFYGVLAEGVGACCLPGAGAEEAESFARGVIEDCGEDLSFSVNVGIALYPQAGYEPAMAVANPLKALDHASYLDPGSVVVLSAVTLNVSGDDLYQEGDMEGAMDEYRRALTLDPEDVNVLNSLGVCHGLLGECEKAMPLFEKAAIIRPDEVMPIYNQGTCAMTMGDAEKALGFFEEALKRDPESFESLVQAGRAHLALEKPEKARDLLLRATRIRPRGWAAQKHLGESLARLGEDREAAKAWEQALRIHPNEPETLAHLAGAYLRLSENADIALSFASQSVSLEPGRADFRLGLARLLEACGRYDEALDQAQRAGRLGDDCRIYVEKLARLSEKGEGRGEGS